MINRWLNTKEGKSACRWFCCKTWVILCITASDRFANQWQIMGVCMFSNCLHGAPLICLGLETWPEWMSCGSVHASAFLNRNHWLKRWMDYWFSIPKQFSSLTWCKLNATPVPYNSVLWEDHKIQNQRNIINRVHVTVWNIHTVWLHSNKESLMKLLHENQVTVYFMGPWFPRSFLERAL